MCFCLFVCFVVVVCVCFSLHGNFLQNMCFFVCLLVGVGWFFFEKFTGSQGVLVILVYESLGQFLLLICFLQTCISALCKNTLDHAFHCISSQI